MGWGVAGSGVARSTDFAWYKTAAVETYGGDTSWHSVRAFAEEAKEGDLVWFRDFLGRYYIAELTGPWEYCWEGDHIGADIINLRRARIVVVGLADAGPGRIIASFIPPKCFQPIRMAGMLAFTEKLAGTRVDETTTGGPV
jgi:hypothetical protein